MKKKLLSLFACLTCCIFCISPCFCSAAGLDWAEVIADTVFNALIQGVVEGATNGSDGNGMTGVARQFIDNSVLPYMLETVYQIGDEGIDSYGYKIPKYQIITGKYQLHSTFGEYLNKELVGTHDNDVLIECTLLIPDIPVDNTGLLNYVAIDSNTDIKYFANALNFAVYRTDGTVDRFVCLYEQNIYNKIHGVGSSFISIGTSNYVDVYMYTGGKLTQLIYSHLWTHGIRFYMSESNTITRNLDSIVTNSTNHIQSYPSGFSAYGDNSTPPHDDLSIRDIAEGRAYVKWEYNASYSGTGKYSSVTFYPLDYLFTSFYITNDTALGYSATQNWTTANTQNYYIDNIYQGDTIINNENKNNYFGGALLPAFDLDIDPDLPFADILDLLTDLIPDLKANLQPSLDVNIDSLFDRLFDFYNDMPDIGLPWGDGNNNYWDIEPPAIPDDGGGGGGDITVNVTVDITRPLVTTYKYTDPIQIESLPVLTTYTVPTSVQDNASHLLTSTNNLLADTGLIPIYGFLALVGVGLAILFKGV